MIKIRKHESVTRALAIIFVLLFAVLGYLFLKPSRAANADVNGDGTVNILDLSVLASNWGLSGRTFAQGDLTGDGVVNVLDLSVLASSWGGGGGGTNGSTLTGSPAGSQVCPGGANAATLHSPYNSSNLPPANLDGAHPSNTLVHVTPATFSSTSWAPNKTYYFDPGNYSGGEMNQSLFSGDIIVGLYDSTKNPSNVVLNGGGSQYAISGQASYTGPAVDTNVLIEYLEITNFSPGNGGAGAVNQDSQDGWVMKYNYIHNLPSGAAINAAGSNNVVAYNCLKDNGEYGVQVYRSTGPIYDIVIDHNDVEGNNTANLEGAPTYTTGCGCSGGIHLWEVTGAKITNNNIANNLANGVFVDTNNVDVDIENNYVYNNDSVGLWYETSYNGKMVNNLIVNNAWGVGPSQGVSGFPIGGIYVSESGSDSRVPPRQCAGCSTTFEVSNNTLTNNYGGVTIWENADRYCGSPANTSTGNCTLVNASATETSCRSTGITSVPLINDCRWKTQNVKVHHNVFNLNQSTVPNCNHTSGHMCGYMAIISQYGTSQGNSDPFLGPYVANNITYNQGNVFSNNTYSGYWCFDPFFQGNSATFSTWRAGPGGTSSQWGGSPYNQDSGSTYISPNTSC